MRNTRWYIVTITMALALLSSGCGSDAGESPPEVDGVTQPTPGLVSSVEPTPAAASSPTDEAPELITQPEPTLRLPQGEPSVVADGLELPWSLVFVDDMPLFTQRDRATVSTIVDGTVVEVGEVPGVRPEAEGGLLGLAVSEDEPGVLFVYFTGAEDNRVVRMPLTQDGDSFALGEPEPIVTGIPKARAHNGGRIKFGPDGKLYIATGDAGEPSRSQDPASLGGKILRIEPDGSIPADNPNGDLMWSMGHRNVQGLAWSDDEIIWASEFGLNTWDELNIIEPGNNYGWPKVEGSGGEPDFVDPVVVWPPEQASPSGLLHLDGYLYLASLRGERLWSMVATREAAPTSATDIVVGDRLRDVVNAPDGTIWVLTSNGGGDRILSYTVDS